MRIVIDMQGAQTDSRKRGIGRYTRGLAEALLRNRGEHEILLVLNGLLPEGAAEVFSLFFGLLAPGQIRVWNGPDHSQLPAEPISLERREAEGCYERFILGLRPDAVLLTTMLAEVVDPNFTCALSRLSLHTLVAAIAYDFLPLAHPEKYLADPVQSALYYSKLNRLKEVDIFLSISEYTASETRRIFPDCTVEYIGTDTDAFFRPVQMAAADDAPFRDQFGIPGQFFFYAGGLDRRKNLVALVRAYSQLSASIRADWQLVLAVDKEKALAENPELRDLLAVVNSPESEAARVVCTGRIDDEVLLVLYSACSLFIFPSLEEGFGLPVLEAMRCGAPVIVADGTSLTEVMTWPGARFDPSNPEAIASLMERAVTDSDFMGMLREKAQSCQQKFSWDAIAKRALAALERGHAEKTAVFPRSVSIPSLSVIPEVREEQQPVHQLFIDISNIALKDAGTGVQRVVRSVLVELLHNPPVGWVVRPVYLNFAEGKFRHAHNYLWFNQIWNDTLPGDIPITFNAGDFLLRLDLNCQDPGCRQSTLLRAMHDAGVIIYTVVYDLIPVTHPQFCSISPEEFGAWLHTLSCYDGAICISRFVAGELNHWLSENVPNRAVPLDVSWFHLGSEIITPPSAGGIPSTADTVFRQLKTAPTFLMVSTIEPRKGYVLALDAFDQLWDSGENVNLVFVGRQGWKVEAFCERMLKHPQQGKHFFWVSDASDEYLGQLYEAADAVIMASEVEGFGLAVVEAAHHHKDVILRDIPVFHEIAGEHALYFDGTAEALAKAVQNWMGLDARGQTPDSSGIPMMSWKESTEMLLSRLPLFRTEKKEKPLTVLFSTWQAAFDCPGGGEIQLLRYEDYLKKRGIRVIRFDPWKPCFDDVDIVHCFSVMGGTWNLPWYVHHRCHLPLVVSPIVWLDHPESYPIEEIGTILGCADRILPNSQSEGELLQRQFNLDSSQIIPIVNGVEDIFFEPADPQIFREHFNLDKPFVLCVGNIERRKNQLNLIRSLKGTGLHLVIAGQEREADYAGFCHTEADQTVHFVSVLEHAGLLHRSAYAAAEAFVLPSILETPGLAALEAAAAGCRLVVTSGGCTEEYFGAFAFYCDPHHTENIRDTVFAALKSPRTKALSEHVRKHFTWQRAAEQLDAIYRDTMIQHRAQKSINPDVGHPRARRNLLYVESTEQSTSSRKLAAHLKAVFSSVFDVVPLRLGTDPGQAGKSILDIREECYDFVFVHDIFPASEQLAELNAHRLVSLITDSEVQGIPELALFLWKSVNYITTDEKKQKQLSVLGFDVSFSSCESLMGISTEKTSPELVSLLERMEHLARYDKLYWGKVQTFSQWKHILPELSSFPSCTVEVSGWYPAEPAGVWSKQKNSITLPVYPREQMLVLSVEPYLPRTVDFSVNDQSMLRMKLDGYADVALHITEKMAVKKSVVIGIAIEETLSSPKELGIGDDIRTLGLFLSKMRLQPVMLSACIDCDFTDASRCVNNSGWWSPEGPGRWSVQRQSSFMLFTTPGAKILNLTLYVAVRRTVHVLVNGTQCGTFEVNGSQGISALIPSSAVDDGTLVVELLIDEELRSSKELGISNDTRKLGLYLSRIQLQAVTASPYIDCDFSNEVTCVNASGWWSPEGPGRWSVQRQSSFMLFTTPGAKILNLTLYVAVRRTVHVLVNGTQCGTFEVNGSQGISALIPSSAVDDGTLVVELLIDEELRSSKELGISNDTRKLGLYLSRIQLQAVTASPYIDCDFSNEVTCVNASGWWSPEGPGRWSVQRQSSFMLFTTPGAKMLELNFYAALQRTVHLLVNEMQCAVCEINGSQSISAAVPSDVVGGGKLSIELQIEEELYSPKALGIGKDTRTLGVYLTHVKSTPIV